MKFDKSMIGRRVMENSTGDEGIVECERERYINDPCDRVFVKWETGAERGYRLHILLDSLTFVDSVAASPEPEFIEINGKRYKLVPV